MDKAYWDVAIAATISGGATAAIARAYISKTLKDLETVLEKVSEIKAELRGISVKLDHLDESADIVSKHDRKIAAMEEKLYGHGKRAPHISRSLTD